MTGMRNWEGVFLGKGRGWLREAPGQREQPKPESDEGRVAEEGAMVSHTESKARTPGVGGGGRGNSRSCRAGVRMGGWSSSNTS